MYRIDLPAPLGSVTAAKLISNAVLTLPFWRADAELKRVESCLRISDELEANPQQPRVTLEELELLRQAMVMGQNVITDSKQNLYYLRVMRAVLRAEPDESGDERKA